MMQRSLSFSLVLAALTLPAGGQLATTFGPELAPIGCPVNYSLYNGGPTDTTFDPCGFAVYDAAGNVVFVPPCSGPVVLQPGEAHTSTWPQVDSTGAQVPPGVYHLNDPAGPAVTVGGAEAAIAPRGTRDFDLCAPLDAGFPYLMAASLALPGAGFPLCGQTVPLAQHPFLGFSLSAPSVFQGFLGVLDANGMASAHLNLPLSLTQLFQIDYAFVVLDFSLPCPVRRVSAPTTVVLF